METAFPSEYKFTFNKEKLAQLKLDTTGEAKLHFAQPHR